MRRLTLRGFFSSDRGASFCGIGLVLGTLFFAASLTPSLVPRSPLVQGVLGGFCLAAGYGLGVLLRRVWRALALPALPPRAHQISVMLVLAVCVVAAMMALWWATGWQNRLRGLMQMPAIDSAGPWTIAGLALLTFGCLLALGRLAGWLARWVSRGLSHMLSRQAAMLLAIVITAALFWTIGNGVLAHGAMRWADQIYSRLDALVEDDIAQPVAWDKTGGPGSLIDWQRVGRQGRRMVAAGPDAAEIERLAGQPAREPLRVYVGLNSAPSPRERAELALREMLRVGAFERANLVIATPTGTGWVDPESQSALEYLLHGDVATVSVQYSYLLSWLALLAEPDYGVETARAVFATVYGHWRALDPQHRPRLYLQGLSLGALNGDLSHDLYQVIGAPYQGALWSGPPFNTPSWQWVTADRNAGSPAWLPTFGDGSVVRFTAQENALDRAPRPWGDFRVVFLQYASDAVTFFDARALWRRPDWMVPPLGPDVSPDIRWIPVVTFLQLAFDLALAVEPPKGHGHVYAFDHYVDAWASLISPSGWTPESLAALKRAVAAAR
ncbi:MAG TPA: alpha/beta-hydrolase family protein [Bordetella sp.]|nr:alpha/beta-hydrolase family protein [Bordetella sp.]